MTSSTTSVVERLVAVPFGGSARRPPWWSASRRFPFGDRLDALRGGVLRGGPHPGSCSPHSLMELLAAVPFRGQAGRPPCWSVSRRSPSEERLDALRVGALRSDRHPGTGTTPPVVECFAAVPLRRPARRPPWWSASRWSPSGHRLDASRGTALRGAPLPRTGLTPSVVERFAAVPFQEPPRLPSW